VVDRTFDALTQQLTSIMADRAELVRRGHAGRVLAMRFRWPAVAAQLASLYDSVEGTSRGVAMTHTAAS
jgi:hypothetical protein